ncbi:hypothetical protein FVEG_16098 [Fusarium verticillioides 7600]|uniref:Uncharacterized protein n=1 Tax=Gibberella moniliformis (strain M3125 / FGSC 7600) TaxID=334819 RepID=W7M6S0_GIBM7|nr:hypothetical protein FVEG_16098 [Fusarium verticillioides 7600]EWG47278.1 hypothetical protein FVEG_16098 [Fusarium verticillioides 7600]
MSKSGSGHREGINRTWVLRNCRRQFCDKRFLCVMFRGMNYARAMEIASSRRLLTAPSHTTIRQVLDVRNCWLDDDYLLRSGVTQTLSSISLLGIMMRCRVLPSPTGSCRQP